MKILIISGFLGAGKTTFIKELIKRTNKKIVVLENEYGNVDVDRRLIEEEKADVWDLMEGCVCCTKSADLNASVITIESTLEPEYLVIEPSGIGALSNILRNLKKIEYERITLLSPLTILDVDSFLGDNQEFLEIYKDQIQNAAEVVISKPERPDSLLMSRVVKCVHDINPNARVLPTHYKQMPDSWWNSLLSTKFNGEIINEKDETELNLDRFTLSPCRTDSPTALLWILEQAAYGRFGNIIRAKGILKAGKEFVSFDLVNGKITISGLGTQQKELKSECVWIGRNIDKNSILNYLCDPMASMMKRPLAGKKFAS